MTKQTIAIDAHLAADLAKTAEEKGIAIGDVIHAHAEFVEATKNITNGECKDVLAHLLRSVFTSSTTHEGEQVGEVPGK